MPRKTRTERLMELEPRRQAVCKGIHERMGKKVVRNKTVKKTQKEYQNLPMRKDPGVKVRKVMEKVKKKKFNRNPNITNQKIEMQKIENPLAKFMKK